jgi:hypothetical protein
VSRVMRTLTIIPAKPPKNTPFIEPVKGLQTTG